MNKAIFALFLLVGTARAAPIGGLNDYGALIAPSNFSTHCVLDDPGISGSPVALAYSNGQVGCMDIQALYSAAYVQIRTFLTARKFDFSQSAPKKLVTLRILTLAELNDPNNFSNTDRKCMNNSHCQSGAFFGRSFYSYDYDKTDNITIYVVYSSVGGKYSFISTLKHELMHAILYRYRWDHPKDYETDHNLIDKFLEWTKR